MRERSIYKITCCRINNFYINKSDSDYLSALYHILKNLRDITIYKQRKKNIINE